MLHRLFLDVLLEMLASALVVTPELGKRAARTRLGTRGQMLLDLAARAVLEPAHVRAVDQHRRAHLNASRGRWSRATMCMRSGTTLVMRPVSSCGPDHHSMLSGPQYACGQGRTSHAARDRIRHAVRDRTSQAVMDHNRQAGPDHK